MNTSTLNYTEIWHLSAQALHTDEYISNYIDALQGIIIDPENTRDSLIVGIK